MAYWKWWTVFVLTITALVISKQVVDLKYYLIDLDITHLSLVIIAIFTCTSLVIGYCMDQ